MSSWPSNAAHPTEPPVAKHHLYAPQWPPPTSITQQPQNFLSSQSSVDIFNTCEHVVAALSASSPCSQKEEKIQPQMIANVYTYPDGPNRKMHKGGPFGGVLLIVGYARRSFNMIQDWMDMANDENENEDNHKNNNPTTAVSKCTLGAHRAEESSQHRHILAKSDSEQDKKVFNSDQISKLNVCLFHSKSVALVKLDGHGRVGLITPRLLDSDDENHCANNGFETKYRGRGTYALLCFYCHMDVLTYKLMRSCRNANSEKASGYDEVRNGTENGVNSDDIVNGADNVDGDSGLWQPSGSMSANGVDVNRADNDVEDGGGLWQPPGSMSNDYDNDNDIKTSPFGPLSSALASTAFSNYEEQPGAETLGCINSRDDAHHQQQSFHKDSGAAAADAFYSGLTREMESRADSRLFHMRAFNGWVKAIQIAELNPQTGDDGNAFNDYLVDADGSMKKKRKRKGALGGKLPPLRVLDLACGKGGDLGKWILHKRGVFNYVGIDVARGSLKDAARRAIKLGRDKLKNASFVCADLGEDVPGSTKKKHRLSTWRLLPEMNANTDPHFDLVPGGGISRADRFDVVSIQFAIHYMMSTRKRALRFFHTVANLLEVGGNLVATTIDARIVLEHLMGLGVDLPQLKSTDPELVVSVGNGACRLTFEAATVMKIFGIPDLSQLCEETTESRAVEVNPQAGMDAMDASNFGLQYTFTLIEGSDHAAGVGEAVNLPEWLSPIPVLQALAFEAGLEVTSVENFHEFFARRSDFSTYAFAHNALYNMHVLGRDGSISEDEWEISRLYMAIKFTKTSKSRIKIDEESDNEDENDFSSEQSKLTDFSEVPHSEGVADPKKLAMAMMKAKRVFGSEAWAALTSEEKKIETKRQLDND